MNLQPYTITKYGTSKNTYQFISSGRSKILKVVELQVTDRTDVFNLAMGDMMHGEISYSNITNNNDTDRIMQTVGHIVQVFTLESPKGYVFVKGDTRAKTRLYQRYLSNNLEKVTEIFKVWGGDEDGSVFEIFTKGKNYGAFLVKRI